MSTCSVIGEIRNSKVKAVYVKYDGYPSGVGSDIQAWLKDHSDDIEAFLCRLFTYGQWRDVYDPFEDTHDWKAEYTSLEQIAKDVFIEWVYLFNIDTGQFYICDKDNGRNIVVCQCPFKHINTLDFDSMSGYEDVNEEVLARRELPELTLED
jgi:hypothetical protein